jgi:hypothetical protein
MPRNLREIVTIGRARITTDFRQRAAQARQQLRGTGVEGAGVVTSAD